jgi:hypothetical protein
MGSPRRLCTCLKSVLRAWVELPCEDLFTRLLSSPIRPLERRLDQRVRASHLGVGAGTLTATQTFVLLVMSPEDVPWGEPTFVVEGLMDLHREAGFGGRGTDDQEPRATFC